MNRRSLIALPAIIVALSVSGCGIDTSKTLENVFNVETTNEGFGSTQTNPTPTQTTPTTPEKPSPVPDVSIEAPVAPAEVPADAIPIDTAIAEATDTASAAARRHGEPISPLAWDVSCSSDESETQWSCSLSSGSCAGDIQVRRSSPSGPAIANADDLWCGGVPVG